MITIDNEVLTVQVAELGAELQSIKDDEGKEYLWHGDPKYWPRRSPILFPIVCSVNNDTYRVDGREYHLPRHGFARDTEFTVIAQGEDKVTLAIHETEKTLEVYPYFFNLAVSYKLKGNAIHVVWHVENTGKDIMHFQIGGHPAFLAPGCKSGQPLKGLLKTDGPSNLTCLKSYADGSHEMREVAVASNDGLIVVDDELFANDSVKIHGSQTSRVELLNEHGHTHVAVDCKTPVVALWNPYKKGAPFVCIEPWYGIGDPRGFDGEFKDKPLMNSLQPGASFMSEYVITIGDDTQNARL